MKTSPLFTLGLFLTTFTVAAPAIAGDQIASAVTTPSAKAEPVVDCSKETWPNVSQSCLRNANQATQVRLIIAPSR
jgi:hypothetical protein